MKKFTFSVLSIATVLCIAQATFAATYVVTKTADIFDGTCDADCSLRDAVSAAGATVDDDIINFSPAVFGTPQSIVLNGTDLVINNNGKLSIIGPGPGLLTISGNSVSRVFSNNTGAITTLANMKLTGGTGVSTITTGRGGAVYNNGGTLTLINLVFTGNLAPNGGAFNTAGNGTTVVTNCQIFGNAASTGSGGAFQNFSGSTTHISGSSIYSNTSNSTSTGGGAIQANGTVTITNSTLANNNANGGSGGAIFFNGTAITITNSTIAGNTAPNNSSGIYRTGTNPVNIRNSIISGNTGFAAAPDVGGIINSQGNNIIGTVGTSSGWVGTDLQNTNPLLSPLGFYGGTGLSFALLGGSPALNAGDNCVVTLTCSAANPLAAVTVDQRGATRPTSSTVDIGAFEVSPTFRAYLPNAIANQSYLQTIAGASTGFGYAGGVFQTGITLNDNGSLVTVGGTATQTGTTLPAITFTANAAPAQTATVNYSLTVVPAAGSVSVGGRVFSTSGRPLRSSWVTISDSTGLVRSTLTSSFGYYNFDGLADGVVYTVTVSSKQASFSARSVQATGNVTDLDFLPAP